MLTLNSAFTEEFSKAEAEAVLLVEIYTGKTLSTLLALCTGSEGFTFSTIVEPYDSASLGEVTVHPLVISCTPVSMAMDPYERTVVKNSVTVTLANHPFVRTFIKNNIIHGRAVIIKMGTRDITNELHWAPVFMGVAESVSCRQEGIDIECRDFWRWRGAALTHGWVNKHPLEVVKLLLEAQGVPSEYIEDDLFDPDHADYASTIGHYVTTHPGTFIHPQQAHPAGVYWVDDQPVISMGFNHPHVDTSQQAITEEFEPLIQSLVKLMIGCLYFDESGQIRFVAFDKDRAASVNWTADDVRDFVQAESLTVNEIEMEFHGERVSGGIPTEGLATIKDSTSQTAHAFPDESVGIFRRSEKFPHVSFHGTTTSVHGTAGLSPLLVSDCYGISGTRVPDGNYSNPWEDMQGAGAGISADKPIYLLIDNEVMKCVSMNLVEDQIVNAAIWGMNGTTMTVAQKPARAEFTITSGNRGAIGTTAAEHLDSWLQHQDPTEPPNKVFDCTMHVNYALVQLQRFSNGCPFLELTTNVSQWAIQVGDFVTVTDDSFLAYGFDGVDSGHKWEVIGKELTLHDGDANIKFALAYATKASPPSINATYTWPQKGVRGLIDLAGGLQYASEDEVGVSRHTVMGLGSSSSGLVVTIQKGMVGSSGRGVPVSQSQAITVTANKDHYFSVHSKSGHIQVDTVTTGAAQPALGRFSVPIAKVVAGGSTCALTDLREFGAVRPRNLSSIDFEQGANLVPNPDFETWSRGSSYTPDHWEVRNDAVVTWGTDATREETTTYSGNYALNINLSSLGGSYIQSHPFRVERDRVYQFGISVKGSSTTAQCMVQIEWLTEAKAAVSTPILVNHNASADTTDMTRYDVFTTAPATAVYARVLLSKWSDASPANGIFDAIRMVRAMPSFHATNTTQTYGTKVAAVVDFDTEVYDYGDAYAHATGRFTATFAGTYMFKGQILDITNDHADSFIVLLKNGSVLFRGTKSDNGYEVDSGPIVLAAGDYIEVGFDNQDSSTATITGSATKCWFSGAQIA